MIGIGLVKVGGLVRQVLCPVLIRRVFALSVPSSKPNGCVDQALDPLMIRITKMTIANPIR
jgi:hypothetical protein